MRDGQESLCEGHLVAESVAKEVGFAETRI
jgi:hypothetical protein